jgi:hypothetical protein
VFNLAGKAPSYNDNDSRFASMKELESISELFLTVPKALIIDDRTSTPVQQTPTVVYEEKYPEGISSWDGDHTTLKKLIKQNMNDEDSYEHIDTSWIYIESTTKQTEINTLLEGIGWSEKVSVGDFVIITEFSGKNAFNATVKTTAYGIEYKDGSVILLGFA